MGGTLRQCPTTKNRQDSLKTFVLNTGKKKKPELENCQKKMKPEDQVENLNVTLFFWSVFWTPKNGFHFSDQFSGFQKKLLAGGPLKVNNKETVRDVAI